jgi:hypothetical protein
MAFRWGIERWCRDGVPEGYREAVPRWSRDIPERGRRERYNIDATRRSQAPTRRPPTNPRASTSPRRPPPETQRPSACPRRPSSTRTRSSSARSRRACVRRRPFSSGAAMAYRDGQSLSSMGFGWGIERRSRWRWRTGAMVEALPMAWRARVIQTQVKGVAAHMKQAKAWTSVEVTERLAAQPPPPPRVPRVLLRESHRVDGVGDASPRWCEDK